MTQSINSPVAQLNDQLRRTFLGGTVVMTHGVQSLPEGTQKALIQAVQSFDRFDEDNDPYGEHDFAMIQLDGQTFYWKIDYYDLNLEYRSEDPADPAKTKRVLTLMRAEEY